MRSLHAFATVLAVGLAVAGPRPAASLEPPVGREQIVPEARLARTVGVRGVEDRDGVVSGTVVNNSDKVVTDVRLAIRRSWLWDDEFHPGTDDPSRTEFYTITQEIPPGGQMAFTYRPEIPLREGRGGHFETDVHVTSLVEYSPTPSAALPSGRTTAPSAGAGAAWPVPPAESPPR